MSQTYEDLGRQIGALVGEKQQAYGDSFGKSGAVMRILYPDGITLEKLDDALTVVRVLDKLFRVATSRDALGESPWRDIAGYALLATRRVETSVSKAPTSKPPGPATLAESFRTRREASGPASLGHFCYTPIDDSSGE